MTLKAQVILDFFKQLHCTGFYKELLIAESSKICS